MYKNYLIMIHYKNADGITGDVKRNKVYFGITEEVLRTRVVYDTETESVFVYEFEITGSVNL